MFRCMIPLRQAFVKSSTTTLLSSSLKFSNSSKAIFSSKPKIHTSTLGNSVFSSIRRSLLQKSPLKKNFRCYSASATPKITTTTTPTTLIRRVLRISGYVGLAGVGVGTVFLGHYVYNHQLEISLVLSGKTQTSLPPTAPPPPPDEFSHPFGAKPLWWQILFSIRRTVTLVANFIPLAFLSCVFFFVSFENNKEWRAWWLELLVETVENGGCCCQKFGQWLSMRPDVFAEDLCNAMGKLRCDAPSHDISFTRQSIKDSFGKEIEELFIEFDESPIASGSIAQVYKARLRPELAAEGNYASDEVAVKVRHPAVLAETYLDASLLFNAMGVFGDMLMGVRIPFDKDQFSKALQMQLDFNWEAYNLQRFAHNFSDEINIQFPFVSSNFVSSSVLIESWVHGDVVETIFSDVGYGYDSAKVVNNFCEEVAQVKRNLARILFDMSIKMYVRDNYVHGDLHGGNMIAINLFKEQYERKATEETLGDSSSSDNVVLSDDGKKHINMKHAESSNEEDSWKGRQHYRLGVIDAGLTTYLHEDIEKPFGYFLLALCSGDTENVVNKLIDFTDNKDSLTEVTKNNFRKDTDRLMSNYIGDGSRGGALVRAPDGSPVDVGGLMGEVLKLMLKHDLVLRGDIAVTVCTMSVTESAIRQLDPDFDIVKNALPYFVRFRHWRTASLTSDLAT